MDGELRKNNTALIVAHAHAAHEADHQDTAPAGGIGSGAGACSLPGQQGGGGPSPSGGALAGYVFVAYSSVAVHIGKLVVAPEWRRMGVGALLMQEVLLSAAVPPRRCMAATLYVSPANALALRLYSRLGFADDGVLHDYYGRGRHAAKMALDLGEWRERQQQQP
ncbi:hypothetical protein FOA52_011925 [Chlamydomonas sp. UWO 241]|nr:hypothetical protein FOA52_011925 [Chlamydomonas sp. UWO 241]